MPDDAHKQKQIHNIALQLGFELRKSLNRTKDIAWWVFDPVLEDSIIITKFLGFFFVYLFVCVGNWVVGIVAERGFLKTIFLSSDF